MTTIYASFAQETTYVLQGTVTADAADGALTVSYTLTDGDAADVLPDMEVELLRDGAVTGRLRVRGSGSTSTSLHVNEFSAGQVQVLADDTFRVIQAWRIRNRLPAADETFSPDQEAYIDQHSDPAPIACSGGHKVGFSADLTAVQHDGSQSRTIDPDSQNDAISHDWSMPNSNTSASESPAFDYSGLTGGTYWGSHVVTDTDNSKTTTQRVCIRVHDANDLPYEIKRVDLTGTPENGTTATVTMDGDVDIDDVPDGSLGWIWKRADDGSVTILYEGYLVRDTVEKDPDREELTFEMISARGVLEQLPGFSTVLETVFSADSWLEAVNLTVDTAIVYRLRELTTVLVTCDLELDWMTALPFPRFYLQEQVPYAQVQELADGVDCMFTCTRTNGLRIAKPVYYMTSDERTAASIQTTLTDDHIKRLNEVREHRYGYNLVEGRGFLGEGPLFSRAPGGAPSEAPQKTTVERKIVFNQADLNQRTGRYYGRLNKLYFGTPTRASSVDILSSLYGLDPAYVDQWVKLNNITTYRGLTHSNTRMSLESYSEAWDADSADGNPQITLELQEETDGVAGITYIPPQDDGIGDYTDPGDIWESDPFPLPTAGLGKNSPWLFLPNSDGYLYVLDRESRSWSRYAMSLTGTPIHWSFDAFSPQVLGTGTEVRGWLATSSRIYYVENGEDPDTITFTQVSAGLSNAGFVRIASERGTVNRVICIENRGGGGTFYHYTVDGSTWVGPTALADTDGNQTSKTPAAFVSGKSNLVIAGGYDTIYKTTDATPTVASMTPLFTIPGGRHAGGFYVPWNQATDDVCYFGGASASGNLLIRGSIVNGTTTDISPTVSSKKYGPVYNENIAISPNNRMRMIAILFDEAGRVSASPSGNWVMVRSNNGGDSWELLQGPTAFVGGGSLYLSVAMTDDNTVFFYGTNGMVGISYDFGTSIEDLTYDITDLGSPETFVGIWGA
jgi:hypothetical protein